MYNKQLLVIYKAGITRWEGGTPRICSSTPCNDHSCYPRKGGSTQVFTC